MMVRIFFIFYFLFSFYSIYPPFSSTSVALGLWVQQTKETHGGDPPPPFFFFFRREGRRDFFFIGRVCDAPVNPPFHKVYTVYR
jgi:hypothetical protein